MLAAFSMRLYFNNKRTNMTAVLTFTRESQLGFKARKLRIARRISQQELADKAGVSVESVDLFEHNLPLALDYKRRILRVLWSIKTGSDARRATSRV
jgi:DNA-binding XRE family transcriptional regulator